MPTVLQGHHETDPHLRLYLSEPRLSREFPASAATPPLTIVDGWTLNAATRCET
jgi:hypothetical protein